MKKVIILFLAIIISICAVSSAFAANWVELERNSNSIIYGDTSSLQYNGSRIRVWQKVIYRNNEDIKNFSRGLKGKIAYCLDYMEYDVNNRTYKCLGRTYYDKSGSSLVSYGEEYIWEQIPPETVVEYLFNFYKKTLKIE